MGLQTVEELVAGGEEALARGSWEEARERFEAALEREESARACEGLGWAGWWLADETLTLRSRERAYRIYRSDGDAAAAGRLAAWLAADYREFRGEPAVARGWIERAHRLLDELPESVDHGWLALMEGDIVLNLDGELDEVERLSRTAARIGREHGVPDLEAVGLAQEGIATVVRGEVEAGMRLLDEAQAMAASEELQLPASLAWSMCCLISACDGVGDFQRATQWCEAMSEFTDRWGGRQLMGLCRSAYGRVLATSGDWEAAESELTAAVADLEAARPGMSPGGLVRLAELRARQGRTEEARELYERAGPAGTLGRGELALDAGDAAAAADAAERTLRRTSALSLLDRLPALELLARARAASGELEPAERALAEVEAAVDGLGTPYLRGRTRLVAGVLARERGDHEEQRRACEDAIDAFSEGGAPYDAAIARLGLAGALAALGREEQAAAETEAAREALAALGASADVEYGGVPPGGTGHDDALGELTPRELEILGLVAQGLSDAEIAERLVLSPHTVHRHVANVRNKLRLPSRAAAVAYAARAGLL